MIFNMWSIPCMTLITDGETNLVSYVNALEAIKVPQLPVILPLFTIGTMWWRDSDKEEILNIRLRFERPDNSIDTILLVDKFKMVRRRHRSHLRIGNLQINHGGFHFFLVEQLQGETWKTVSRLPFEVTIAP